MMRNGLKAFLGAFLLLSFTAAAQAEKPAPPLPENTAAAETIKVSVNGLVCSFCATGIEKTFKKQAAVSDITVDLDHKLVTILTRPGQKLDDATITRLITASGYSVTGIAR
jgi:copper chaperone CopZ